jgi:hypothetical protein
MKVGLRFAAVFLFALIARSTGSTISRADAANESIAANDGQQNRQLIQRSIPPQATDAAIDTFLDPHYVWVDPTRKQDPKLWVFLPSAQAKPADFQLIGQEVAHLGYHVINLMYPNGDVFINICTPLPDANERESCYADIRLQTLDGIQRSSFTNVNPPTRELEPGSGLPQQMFQFGRA